MISQIRTLLAELSVILIPRLSNFQLSGSTEHASRKFICDFSKQNTFYKTQHTFGMIPPLCSELLSKEVSISILMLA